jgi:hypothetical protein
MNPSDTAAFEQQLATRREFVKRVEGPDGLFRWAGTAGVLGLLAAVSGAVQGKWTDALSGLALGVVIGLALAIAGMVRSRLALVGIHAAYLERGWIAAQAAIGLVKDSSGEGSGVMRRDESLTSGRRGTGIPIVLVGGRHTPRAEVEAAAAQVRDWVSGTTDAELRVHAEQIHKAAYDGRDASTFLPVPPGMHLAVVEGRDEHVVAVPGAAGRRRAIRHYRIR